MELTQVRYFLALCKNQNFTRAAKHCGVAQPSLSQSIKALELELGGLLFIRRPTGVELTELGREIEPYFAVIERCVQIVRQMPWHVSTLDQTIANGIASRLALPPAPKLSAKQSTFPRKHTGRAPNGKRQAALFSRSGQ